jgi:hypothetical protein
MTEPYNSSYFSKSPCLMSVFKSLRIRRLRRLGHHRPEFHRGRTFGHARTAHNQPGPMPATMEPPGKETWQSTMRQYEFQYAAFARWMQEKHPHIVSLRDVTQSIAEEYAASLNHGKFTPSTYNKHLNLLTLVFRVLKNKARLPVQSGPGHRIRGCQRRVCGPAIFASPKRHLSPGGQLTATNNQDGAPLRPV